MSKEATLGELIDFCFKVGWDEGIKYLENTVRRLENIQADLYAGTPAHVRQAAKLTKTIYKQSMTIAKLKEYKEKNKL